MEQNNKYHVDRKALGLSKKRKERQLKAQEIIKKSKRKKNEEDSNS